MAPLLFLLHCAAGLMACLALCVSPALAQDDQKLTLRYQESVTASSGAKSHSELIYQVDAERTVIRQDGLETIIDYQGLALSRNREGSSVTYPLLAPEIDRSQPLSPQDGLMRRVAAYRLAQPGAGLVIRGLPTIERGVWFGPGPSLSLIAKPLTIEYFGQTFGERRLQCWVSQRVANYPALAEIARSHRAVVRANPLLLQIDPTNLILPLDGLPVRLQEYRDDALHRLELLVR